MKKDKITEYIPLAILIAFYMFFSFYDGAILCVDSPSYVNMNIFREPVYSLLLAFFRIITNGDGLFATIVFQGLVTSYATFSLAHYLTKEYSLKRYQEYGVIGLFLAFSLMCRFLAARRSMYSNCILSEGIAYPLFILFFRYILEYLNTNDKKSLIISCVLSFVLISTRKQMYISLFLILFVLFIMSILNKNIKKGLLSILVVTVMVFFSCKLFDYAYTHIISGLETTHTSDNRFISTMIFFTSKEEYADYIENKDAKEVFIEIYDVIEEKGYVKKYNNSTWLERIKHFANNYDNIQVYTMWPMMQDYVKNELGIEGDLVEVKVDDLNNEIISSLLPVVLPELIKTYVDNVFAGFMITISNSGYSFALYSLFIYSTYIGIFIYLFIKNGFDKYTKLGLLTIVSLIINVALVSLVIFNQTRYTMYNMMIFYTSYLMLVYRMYQIVFKKKA